MLVRHGTNPDGQILKAPDVGLLHCTFNRLQVLMLQGGFCVGEG